MWELRNLSIKGIICGIGFDLLASILFVVIVAFMFAAITDGAFENSAKFQLAFESSFNVRLVLLIGGLLIAFAMGFIAEWLASTPALLNAAICGLLMLILTLTMGILFPSPAPMWSQTLYISGVIPLSILGGWLLGTLKNA